MYGFAWLTRALGRERRFMQVILLESVSALEWVGFAIQIIYCE